MSTAYLIEGLDSLFSISSIGITIKEKAGLLCCLLTRLP